MNKYVQEELMMKVEHIQKSKCGRIRCKPPKWKNRILAWAQIANRQYKVCDLYVTVKEEELISATLGNKEDNDEEVLAMVAHYVLICYAEKEVIKKKKEYKQKSGQYQLKARIKRFGKQGEMEVTTKSTY